MEEIKDQHVQIREQLTERAERENKSTRNIKVDSQYKAFEYSDITVKPGATYLYKIVPVNQGNVEGEVNG